MKRVPRQSAEAVVAADAEAEAGTVAGAAVVAVDAEAVVAGAAVTAVVIAATVATAGKKTLLI